MMVEFEGYAFIFAGLLLALNQRIIGGLIAAAAIGLALLYMLKMFKGCVPCNMKKYDEYWRLLTLLGTIGFLMIVPATDDESCQGLGRRHKKHMKAATKVEGEE